MSSTRDIIEQHIEAFNSRDADSEPWSADAKMEAPGASVSGRDEVLGFLSVFQTAFPDGQLQIGTLVVDGTAAAVEGSFVGQHDGVLQSPNGEVPPTGKPVNFRWAAVYETTGDELVSEHLFFDQLDFLTQLGLA